MNATSSKKCGQDEGIVQTSLQIILCRPHQK